MSVFGDYAKYYDLLYRDKDYAGEARFVKSLLDRYAPGAKSILELGCGSGKHAALLAEMGSSIHGVDFSAAMLAKAQARVAGLTAEMADRLSFSEGDIRTIRLGSKFDAVIALFHVVSYQQTNDDLTATFATAAAHLRPGGVFLLDCWYGPTVLSKPPAVCVKRVEDDTVNVIRLCEPQMLPSENSVIVNYTVFVQEKATGTTRTVSERHRMRYLFAPEVTELFKGAGMKIGDSAEWMTGRAPGLDTFGVYFVGTRLA